MARRFEFLRIPSGGECRGSSAAGEWWSGGEERPTTSARRESADGRNGLTGLWLIDPATRDVFLVRRATPKSASSDVALELGRDDTLTSAQLPGFAVALATIFPG